MAWDDVSMEEGTGVVHIAPGCGEEDFELGKREGLEALIPVDEAGAFFPEYGWLHGHVTAEAAQMIVDDLGQRGRLVSDGEITHRYPVCWRCGTDVVFRLVGAWFIGCDEIRPRMLAPRTGSSGRRPSTPSAWRTGSQHGRLVHLPQALLGAVAPFYLCDDGQVTVVRSTAELRERAVGGTQRLELSYTGRGSTTSSSAAPSAPGSRTA